MEPEFIQELLKSVWMVIIALLSLPILLNKGKRLWTWKRFGAFLLFAGHLALAFSVFTSYTEVEIINWAIRLGITFLLAGILANMEFVVPKIRIYPLNKCPKILGEKSDYDKELENIQKMLDNLKKHNGQEK